tara:strand:+ start:200 stop:2107 length:1908 start_codon:yes stop_codon:yes gene_type:complete
MKKSTELILICSIVALALFARTSFFDEGKYGADFFYHYSVVEQSLEKGFLDARNDLTTCYEGGRTNHPIGYYAIPYFFAQIGGLDLAFFTIPLLLGLLSLLASYFFLRVLFGKKIALFTFFFAAISLAHVSKSYPFSYRGDNIIYFFLMLSLVCLYKGLTAKKDKERKKFAVFAGVLSSLSIIFWNGYPLVFILYFACLIFYMLFQYSKKKDLTHEVCTAYWSLIAQAIIFYVLFFSFTFYGKGLVFGREYYPLLLLFTGCLFWILRLSQKRKSHVPLIIYALLTIIVALFMLDKLYTIAVGFGSIHSVSNIVFEMQSPSWHEFYLLFSFLTITSLIGIYYFIKNFTKEKAFFLGILIPTLYLMFSATRFMYIAAIPFIALTGFFLCNKKIIRKKFDIFKFISILLCIFMVGWMFFVFPPFFADKTPQNIVESHEFLRENSPEDACVVSFPDKGAVTEFFAKRYYFTTALGSNPERTKEMYKFFLSDNKASFEAENTFILVVNTDLLVIDGMARVIDVEEMEFDDNVVKLYENTLIAPNSKLTFHVKESNNFTKVLKVENGEISELQQFFRDGKLFDNKGGKGCIYSVENAYLYFGEELCQSNIYKMITLQEIDGLERVYAKDNIVIYKQLPSAS